MSNNLEQVFKDFTEILENSEQFSETARTLEEYDEYIFNKVAEYQEQDGFIDGEKDGLNPSYMEFIEWQELAEKEFLMEYHDVIIAEMIERIKGKIQGEKVA